MNGGAEESSWSTSRATPATSATITLTASSRTAKEQVRSLASDYLVLRLAPKNATDTRSCLLWRCLLNCRRGRSRRTTPRNGFRCVLVRRVIAFAERTRGALVVDCSLAFTPNAGWTRGRGHRYRAAAAWDHSSTHSPLGGGTIPFCHSFFFSFTSTCWNIHTIQTSSLVST